MIFVTGGTGMLGSYLLLELLKQGKRVIASKREESSTCTTELIFNALTPSENNYFSKIEWVDVDLFSQTDIEKNLHNISEVYHCAAYISNSTKDKFFLQENNRRITSNIVNAALNQKISKFCHVSSIAALGNSTDNGLIDETIIWTEQKNNSTYSTSKYLSEMEVWRGVAEGLNAVIVNPSVILGIGNWDKGSANLFKKLDDGLKYYTLGSSGFVDASDVVSIMIKLMACEHCFSEGYIISNENLSFKDLFDKIAKSLDIRAPKVYATPFLTQLAWRLEKMKGFISGKAALITKESARTAHKNSKYNNSKLLKTISFKYKDLDSSIADIAKIYKSHKV